MFVPLGSGMGPEVLVPPGGPPPQNLPKLEKIRSESSESSGRRSGETTPLDLSKSPDSHKNIRESSDTEDSNPDQRPVRASSKDEIEAQLQFFKAKQLEFLKDQHQKQAAALAAAQAAAVAAQQKSRCEECNINFSKHQNYVAHKKYYCSAVNNQAEKSSPKSSQALPILSDNDDDKSSDDGKSQSRKLSSPSANLIMAGLTSPKDRKEDKEPQLLLKQQELLKEPSDGASASSKISGLLIPPPSLPHFACEGCGIKFKSVSNLQAHQARYCAGLRKASEDAFEAMVIKQKQAAQAAAAQAAAAKLPMLEMMNLLNAKNAEQEKLSSIMMSSMAAAALASAQSGNGSQTAQNGAEDYYCFLCGYKEESVDRLKDHINLHFIGKVKRKHEQDQNGNSEESAKKIKTESSEESESQQLKCQNCDIGFSHLSNFVAHKKYYCRGQQQKSSETNENPAEKQTATTSSPNGKESPK